MIAHNAYPADGFMYVPIYVGPHEHGHPMLNAVDGYYSQSLYVVHGSGEYHLRDTEDGDETASVLPVAGEFLDISANYDKYHCLEAGANGLAVIFFNPIPITNTLSFEKLEPGTATVSATDKTKIVMCVNGPMGIGTQELVAHQHAKVKPGQSFPLSIPEHSLAIVVTVN